MTKPEPIKPASILFIRRDNIGDLVCTTPAISAARAAFPGAKIAVLVNSYNAGVLAGNRDVNEVFIYEKEKHRGDKSRLRVIASNAVLMRRIRAGKFDLAIGCSSSYSPRLARYVFMTGASERIGYVNGDTKGRKVYYTIPIQAPARPMHEVEAVMALLSPLGITAPPPALSVSPDDVTLRRVKKALEEERGSTGREAPLVAFHISSRRPENRWPIASFIKLIERIRGVFTIRPLILWSPGAMDNPLHPGDDEVAGRLAGAITPRPLLFRTTTLSELIAALSLTRLVVCLDGGAMHLAAGLGLPVLTIWGSTDPARWAPWGVEHRILKAPSSKAADVSPDEAFRAFKDLFTREGRL